MDAKNSKTIKKLEKILFDIPLSSPCYQSKFFPDPLEFLEFKYNKFKIHVNKLEKERLIHTGIYQIETYHN